jgi:SAM-dependent methyltransferase
MVELYRNAGLAIYEAAHYGHGEEKEEVAQLLTWYRRSSSRILDLGCSGGLHALELARRGHRVVGVDREPSAVALANSRAEGEGLAAQFLVFDLEDAPLPPLGSFDLIYSIGNVLSHLPKSSLTAVLRRIRGCSAPDGIILFDLLILGPHFPAEVQEEELGILWKRRCDPVSGGIELQGIFSRFNVTENFQLWSYTVAEVLELLAETGFKTIEYAASLDFPAEDQGLASAVCLKFRAQL